MYEICTLDFKWYFVHLGQNKCLFLWTTIFSLKFSLVALITSNYFDFLITVHQYFILRIYLLNIVKKFTANFTFLCIFQLCETQYLHIFWVCVAIECKISINFMCDLIVRYCCIAVFIISLCMHVNSYPSNWNVHIQCERMCLLESSLWAWCLLCQILQKHILLLLTTWQIILLQGKFIKLWDIVS